LSVFYFKGLMIGINTLLEMVKIKKLLTFGQKIGQGIAKRAGSL